MGNDKCKIPYIINVIGKKISINLGLYQQRLNTTVLTENTLDAALMGGYIMNLCVQIFETTLVYIECIGLWITFI